MKPNKFETSTGLFIFLMWINSIELTVKINDLSHAQIYAHVIEHTHFTFTENNWIIM